MIKVREAELKDCPGIARVQVDSYRTAYAGLMPEAYLAQFSYEEQEQDWVGLLEAGSADILLVAESEEGEIVGYTLARAEAEIYPGYDAEIIALHVRKSVQRQGVGRALLREAVEKLSARGCQSVMLWTLKGNPVRRWYEKLGGKYLGEKTWPLDDFEVHEAAYGWEDISGLQ